MPDGIVAKEHPDDFLLLPRKERHEIIPPEEWKWDLVDWKQSRIYCLPINEFIDDSIFVEEGAPLAHSGNPAKYIDIQLRNNDIFELYPKPEDRKKPSGPPEKCDWGYIMAKLACYVLENKNGSLTKENAYDAILAELTYQVSEWSTDHKEPEVGYRTIQDKAKMFLNEIQHVL